MKGESPAGLRIIHAIVFLGFASVTVAGTHQELLQLWRALTHAFSAGTPPHLIASTAGAVAGLGALAVLMRVGLGRRVPLWLSALLLLAFAGSLTLLGHEPQQRTVPGANVKALAQAQALHQRLNGPLQKTGRVPTDVATAAIGEPSPFYRRPLKPLAWHVELTSRVDALPEGAEPGWLLVEIDPSGAAFAVTVVGIDEHGDASLLRSEGKPIEYRGAYNPDMPR